MVFAFEGLPIKPATGFQWLPKTPPCARLTLAPPSLLALCSTLPVAGLGGRPGSFKQRIPVPRQRTLNYGASLFFYSLARTTLLGSRPVRIATFCNCFTIGSSNRANAVLKAGLSRQFDAYYRRSAARRPNCCPKLKAPTRAQRGDAPRSPASQLLRLAEMKA